jgi:regulator of sigma E protease
MPAEDAGIEAGDFIVAVDGERPETWLDVVRLVSSAGEGLVRLEVQRGQEVLILDVEAERSPVADRPMIGIVPGTITAQPPGLLARAEEAVATVAGYYRWFFQGFKPAPSHTRVRAVAGPIAVSSLAAGRAGGASTFWLAATYLPLTCLTWCIVLPYLDGRRLMFLLIEAMARKPIHPKHEQRFNLVWLVIVAGFNVVAMVVWFVL